MKPRVIVGILVGLFAVYLAWLGLAALRFKPYRTKPAPGSLEIEGVYHLHTTFSDGTTDVETLARKAAAAGLNFIILTDHGSPNLRSLASQGWKSGVLVLAGSELSVSRGHLVALDFKVPKRPFPQNAEESIRDVHRSGGLTIIAHPFSKVRWNWGNTENPDGIEVINGDSELRYHFFKSLPWFPELIFNPRLALIKMLGSPAQSLAKWDQLNAKGRVCGYVACDAHLMYDPLLDFVRIHMFLKKPLAADFETARDQVFEALRAGKFYNAVDAAGEARRFRFWAARKRQRYPMGSVVRDLLPLSLRVRAGFSFPKEIRLLRNGLPVASSDKKMLFYRVDTPGTYRVEVYLRGRTPLAKDVPWILSNPIFVREERP
jgi:hypothetical protein